MYAAQYEQAQAVRHEEREILAFVTQEGNTYSVRATPRTVNPSPLLSIDGSDMYEFSTAYDYKVLENGEETTDGFANNEEETRLNAYDFLIRYAGRYINGADTEKVHFTYACDEIKEMQDFYASDYPSCYIDLYGKQILTLDLKTSQYLCYSSTETYAVLDPKRNVVIDASEPVNYIEYADFILTVLEDPKDDISYSAFRKSSLEKFAEDRDGEVKCGLSCFAGKERTDIER